MCIISALDDIAGSGYSEGDSAGTGAGTGTRTKGDMDKPEGTEDKIDIIMLDKTNMTPIIVSH